MERIWPRTSRKYFPVRILVALSIAVPLSLTPIWSEDSARAVTPELVAFSQAGVSAAPAEWANRILVEDFNDQGDTQAQLNSATGITSAVGTFRGSGSANVFNQQQWGGAPCNDCEVTIMSEYNPDQNADPNWSQYRSYTRFDLDISPTLDFLSDTRIIYVPTTEVLNGASSLVITNLWTNSTYTTSIDSVTASGAGFELSIPQSGWDQQYLDNFDPYAELRITVSFPGSDGRTSKFPSVGGCCYGEIILNLASSTTFRYLGFWWSAGSPDNKICLLPETGSTCIAEYDTRDLVANASFNTTGVDNLWDDRPHYGNPRGRVYTGPGADSCSGVTDTAGNPGELYDSHCWEPFAFIHIFQDSGFQRVRFSGEGGTGFEFDNVTASTAESWELIDLLPDGTLLGASTLPAYDLTSPSVIPVDPRSDSAPFPGVMLGGAASAQPNATLCVTEVSSAGTPVASDPSNLLISATVPVGVTSQSSAPRFVYSGTREAIRNLSATIRINNAANSGNVVSTESKYLRISVQARTGTGLTTCAGSNNVITAVIVEVRPIRLNGSYSVGIAID
jgi:hypothetical protein